MSRSSATLQTLLGRIFSTSGRYPRSTQSSFFSKTSSRTITFLDRLRTDSLETYTRPSLEMASSSKSSPTIYTYKYKAEPLPRTSIFLHHFPTTHNRFSEDLPAFIDPVTGFQVTRGALKDGALRLGLGLLRPSLELSKGDVILIFSPNVVEYPVAFFGGQAAGLVTSLPTRTTSQMNWHIR